LGVFVLDVCQWDCLQSDQSIGQILLGNINLTKAAFSDLLDDLIVGDAGLEF